MSLMGKLKNFSKIITIYLFILLITISMALLTAPFHLNLISRGYPGTLGHPWGDAWHYYYMSIFPFNSAIDAPFCYRILTPSIIYLLPLDPLIGYWLFTFICIFITALLFFHYLKLLGFKNFYALIGTIIFLVSVPNFYLFYYTIFVDPLQYLLFLIGCIILLNISRGKIKGTKEIILMMLILGIGILNKETIIFLIPIYAMITKGYKGYKIIKTIIISIPPTIIYLFLRSFIPYSGSTYENIWIGYHIAHWPNSVFGVLITFSLIWILVLPSIYKTHNLNNDSFLKYSSIMVPFFVFQIALASDVYRNVFLGFPIIIPVGLITLIKIENKIFSKNNHRNFPFHQDNLTYFISYIITFFQIIIPILYFLQWDVPIELHLEYLRIFYFGTIVIGFLFIIYLVLIYLYKK